jgi:hypothetical protein
MRNANKIGVGKPKENRPLERPRLRLEHCIKIDLKGHKVGEHGLDSSGSVLRPVGILRTP